MRRLVANLTASLVVVALTWATYLLDPSAWPGVAAPIAAVVLSVVNLAVTAWRPAWKVAAVRRLQRHIINPVVVGLLRVGINPLGVVLLETRGRVSGAPRVTPVGASRARDGVIWVIAEHGHRAGYVRNLARTPQVRVRTRVRGRHTWVAGTAHVLEGDDPYARQRRILGWNPLRWLNAVMVLYLGADLLSIRITLDPAGDAAARDARAAYREGPPSGGGAAPARTLTMVRSARNTEQGRSPWNAAT